MEILLAVTGGLSMKAIANHRARGGRACDCATTTV
jgi:hypothetical protein